MNVVDAIAEAAHELHRVDSLPVEMARVEGEAELLPAVDGVQYALGAVEVEGDLARVYLEGVAQAALGTHVQDRAPRLGEIAQGVLNQLRGRCRVADDRGPNRRPGEAGKHRHTELLRGPGGRDHLLGGTLAHPFRPAVAPDVVGQQEPVPGLDRFADGVTNAVGAQHRNAEVQAIEQGKLSGAVVVLAGGALHLEMITPTAEFHALVAPLGDLGDELFQRHVRPPAAEEYDRPAHREVSAVRGGVAACGLAAVAR